MIPFASQARALRRGPSLPLSGGPLLPKCRIPAACALGLALAGAGTGCVNVYEPLSGLNRPIVVDTTAANFQDLNLAIYCPPGGGIYVSEAAVVCRNVGRLFENQGAVVTTATRDRRMNEEGEAAAPPDLILELRARDVKQTNDPLSWMLCVGTFTLAPGITESSFTQDVTVRDGTGFLLGTDTLRGRLIRSFGVGVWAGNKFLDLVWRDKEEEVVGDLSKRELSADLYQQLSQIVFNAKMRWEVLQEGPTVSVTPNSGSAP